MRVTDIVNSAKLTVGQIFSCPTVQHFQFELLRVSAALTHETGTAMVLVCRHPTSDEAVSDAVFGCEDFVSPFAREVVPNHFQFEPEVEFPHMSSKVVSNSWGSVQTRGDSMIKSASSSMATAIHGCSNPFNLADARSRTPNSANLEYLDSISSISSSSRTCAASPLVAILLYKYGQSLHIDNSICLGSISAKRRGRSLA